MEDQVTARRGRGGKMCCRRGGVCCGGSEDDDGFVVEEVGKKRSERGHLVPESLLFGNYRKPLQL